MTSPGYTVQFSSVAQSCPTLCNPMNHSMPGLPVHHQLPDFTQTHVHRVGDAIQPSHPVVPFSSCPQSLPASESFPMSQIFAWGGQSTRVSALASFFQRNPRADLLQNGLVGSPCSPRDSQESSPTPQFKSIDSSALSFLHSPTLTSIYDHRKNHSLNYFLFLTAKIVLIKRLHFTEIYSAPRSSIYLLYLWIHGSYMW